MLIQGRLRRAALALLLMGPSACTTPETSQTGQPFLCPDGSRGTHMSVDIDPVSHPKLDILVLVDNSMSTAEEQANLAVHFPFLIRELLDPEDESYLDAPPHPPITDMHVGVISLDMGTAGYEVETCHEPIDGDDGRLLHTPNPSIDGCDDEYPLFLSYLSGEPDPDAVARMSTAYGCISTLGLDGCGWEQPLKAIVRALVDHRDGVNRGFLRDDSLLLIVALMDEGDYSVAPGHEYILDASDASLGHLNLRTYYHPEVLVPVEEYIEAFEGLREDPYDLMLTFIMGVPRDEACEGLGSDIPDCLSHPDMIERLDPVSMTRLIPSCVTSTGEAYPTPRFVQIAQHFGDRALMQSICTDNFMPHVTELTNILVERLWSETLEVPLPVQMDDADPCTCRAACTLVEEMSDLAECPPEKPCYEPAGPGTGCAFETDEDGARHPLCTIPQLDTTLDDCSLGCENPGNAHRTGTDPGWYYVMGGAGPRIVFSGALPGSDSRVHLSCCN